MGHILGTCTTLQNFITMVDQGIHTGQWHIHQLGPPHMLIKAVMTPIRVTNHLELVATNNGVVGFPRQPTIATLEGMATINKVTTDFQHWIIEEINCHHNMAEQMGDPSHLLAVLFGGPIHQLDMIANEDVS